MSEPVSPAETIFGVNPSGKRAVDELREFAAELPQDIGPCFGRDVVTMIDALLTVGERDKADLEAAESLAAAHEGRAQSLAAEVERLEQALRESNDLRRVQRHSHDALSRRNVELTEAGERDRRQIAQLTEVLEAAAWLAEFGTPEQRETYECGHGATAEDICPEDCEAHSKMVTAAAVLADEEDAAS